MQNMNCGRNQQRMVKLIKKEKEKEEENEVLILDLAN